MFGELASPIPAAGGCREGRVWSGATAKSLGACHGHLDAGARAPRWARAIYWLRKVESVLLHGAVAPRGLARSETLQFPRTRANFSIKLPQANEGREQRQLSTQPATARMESTTGWLPQEFRLPATCSALGQGPAVLFTGALKGEPGCVDSPQARGTRRPPAHSLTAPL